MDTVRVGLIGSGFISEVHAEALRQVAGVQIVAVASPTPGNAERFAERHGIPNHYTDDRALLDHKEIDLVVIGAPNDLHASLTIRAAEAGKHVVVDKPMALSLEECDRMIAACEKAGVMLGYGEELCYAPKYVRLKRMVDDGVLGRIHLVKQSEKHDGPHSPWFYDTKRSGGGVTLDMGCHAIEFFRWILGKDGQKAKITGAYAQMGTYLHGDRTDADDESLLILDFECGAVGLAEESWTKPGGMDDRAEVFGSEGQAYADLLYGSSLRAYTHRKVGYAVEKAGEAKGWTFPMFEENWNYGFPQEMQHFVDCVREGRTPLTNGHDGRAVLEAIFALYASASEGRRITLPFDTAAERPIDLWVNRRQGAKG